MSFYVTLISDSSKQYFPDNKVSHFITQLPTPIELGNAQYEIGLVDFIYPHSWNTVRKDNNLFGFDLGNGELQGRRVPAGCYNTITQLLKAMVLASFQNKIEFHYNAVTKRTTIKTHGKAKVLLYTGLAEILGFEPGEFQGTVQSPFIANPDVSFPVIYVYCDLIEPQIVGDVQAPLLKIVKVEGKDGDVVNAHFVRPHYVPINRQHFQTIHVETRLNSGELVPFESGKVFLVLHFRLRQIV